MINMEGYLQFTTHINFSVLKKYLVLHIYQMSKLNNRWTFSFKLSHVWLKEKNLNCSALPRVAHNKIALWNTKQNTRLPASLYVSNEFLRHIFSLKRISAHGYSASMLLYKTYWYLEVRQSAMKSVPVKSLTCSFSENKTFRRPGST